MKNKVLKFLNIIVVATVTFIIAAGTSLAAEGDVWIMPANQNQPENQNFDVKVYVDTGSKHLNSFNMYLVLIQPILLLIPVKEKTLMPMTARAFTKVMILKIIPWVQMLMILPPVIFVSPV